MDMNELIRSLAEKTLTDQCYRVCDVGSGGGWEEPLHLRTERGGVKHSLPPLGSEAAGSWQGSDR